MPNSSQATLDRSLARPAPGQDRATGRQEAEDAAKEKLLTDIFDKPFGPTTDRMQIIKEKDSQSNKKEQTLEEVSVDRRADAEKRIADAHKGIAFTTNSLEPKVIPFRSAVAISAETTPLAVAKAELGDKADAKQVEAYAAMLMKINDITGKADEAKIAVGTRVSLPGQRADGGLVYRASGKTTTEWHDGSSITVSERGVGEASFKDKDGSLVTVYWGPDSVDQNYEERVKDNRKWETSHGGDKVESVRENPAADWKMVRQTISDEKGRRLEAEYDAGGKTPKLIKVIDNKEKTTIEVRPDGAGGLFKGEKKNEKGDVVDADVRLRISRQGISIWSQKENPDKSITKTYESGTVETIDSSGKLLKREGKDEWGRKVTEAYESGHGLPQKITVTMKDGKDIEFARKPFGQYQAEYKNEKGERIGVIDLRANGLILFENEKEQKAKAELPDGTLIERTHFGNGRQELKQTKNGETLTKTLDREGTVVEAVYKARDGRTISRRTNSDGSAVESITIQEKDGFKTDIRYNRDSGQFTGQRTNKEGKAVENVHYMQGKLVYSEVEGGKTRFEKLKVFEKDLFNLKLTSGKYDAFTGTLSYKNVDGSKTVESFSPGRIDTIKDGVTRGITITGDRSAILPSGEASVHHADDTGVRLNPDMTIDRWGPEKSDNGLGEPLTKVEGAYLRSHADIDRRDLAEIHRQWHDKPEMLDKFYNALSEIDSAKNLSAAEKAGLRKGLMHHVAFPAELYQGNSWCCNVAVIERDMAMNMPDRYVRTVVQALNDGEITLPNGTKLSTKDCNLREADTTGRDMVTRAFHTLALHAKYQPKYTFRNTPDGAGRLVPKDGQAAQASFNGLDMDDIVDARYKLTGEKKAVVSVRSVDDLVSAWEANGARSMIVAVNADSPPFNNDGMAALFGGASESRPNHVVNITRLEPGPPVTAYIQNQWGLSEDLSTPAKAVDAKVLLKAMTGRVRGRQGLIETPGQTLVPGEPGKTYEYKDGKLVEEKNRA